MTDIKDKTSLHLFLEQLAIPLTTAFMCMLCVWILWVSKVVLSDEEDKSKLKVLETKIYENRREINTNRLKGSIHESEIHNLDLNIKEILPRILREFDQMRAEIRGIKSGK